MKKQLSLFISTLFYVGYFPKAPGTIGSFVSLFFIVPVIFYFGFSGFIFLFIIGFILAMLSITESLKYTKHDPGFIVIDEFVGQTITFMFVASYLKENNQFFIYFIGFIFFRVFDVLKPFPVNYADKKIQNSFGVIFDDILAGIYASICLLITKILIF